MDRAVIAAADELFAARHFPGVVALATDALDREPDSVAMLALRARAYIALGRELDAQADLRALIRVDPQGGLAYRLLGVLAARRSEHESAAIFFREALRLDPHDREARDWLAVVARGGRIYATRPGSEPRFARGTSRVEPQPASVADDDDEAATARSRERARTHARFHRGAEPNPSWHTPPPRPDTPLPLPPPPRPGPETPPPIPLAARRAPLPRPLSHAERPGFGDYLVTTGVLTRERLRAAQAYQRSMKVQLATAIVTLGLASPERLEWAAAMHRSEGR